MARSKVWGATAAVVVTLVGLLMSACSSSAGSSVADPSTPLKLGMIVPVGASVDYAEAVAAAKGAARAVNAAGGVNGHPIEIDFCNGPLDPNKETACVRQLINDKVVATVGNATYTSEKTADELFARAGIAQVGNWASGVSERDPNSYLFFGGQTYANAGQIYAAAKWGGKRVGVVRLDYPYTAPYPDFYRNACVQLGCQVVSTTVIPSNSATDLAPYASQLLSGNPDVIVPDLGPLIAPLLKTMNQLGYKGKMISQDSNINTKSFLAQPADVQNQYIVTTPFPPPSAGDQFPGIKQFLADMQAEKAAGNSDAPTGTAYSQTPTMDAYVAVKVFAKIAGDARASDAASFKKAIDAAKNVDLLGLTQPWTPSQVLFDKLPRASLDSWYFYTIGNGQQRLLNTQPVQVNDIVKTAYAG
ncbi:ABC transporter substrate-binding protein [Amycolatopsis alkalitolerans]|uniref:Amino acid ABC transporter substrate-binding protein n=1 Tax=Amycolatopsis alkalitolerans TaxID=2547244 RepID=A0A5C4LSK0_9PSEU|nr:ABC transporter substrate-binding protein [Amycolatopsis alkalitolerans]TNC20597.1 amino acid ABC transporter substrate-binding protein [Amycolatopsis alkalitolerans]